MLAILGAGGGLLGLGYAVRGIVGMAVSEHRASEAPGTGMMDPRLMSTGPPNMDMGLYMEMFRRHSELTRRVEEIPGGVRTTTESDSPELVAQLQAHVSAMYSNVDQGAEVMCMSGTLPTLFRRAVDYQRPLTFTPKGVVAVETSGDPDLTQVIRARLRQRRHARDDGPDDGTRRNDGTSTALINHTIQCGQGGMRNLYP